jgi:hypothetical protein
LTELSPERFLKRLAGKTDIEEALKRLDKLTNEEARMATAQVLKATRSIDDGVKGVDDRVAAVDAQLAGVNEGVVSVDGRVKAVDGKVAEIIHGAYIILSQSQIIFTPRTRREASKGSPRRSEMSVIF